MSRCLVTGHRGFIGSELYKKLKQYGHEVMGVDYLYSSDEDIRFCLKEESGIFVSKYFDFKPEYIFHLACTTRVPLSIIDPVGTMENNAVSTSVVLNFAKKVGAKRVIFSSSSSVVGNGEGPISPYALQKLFSEKECQLYSKEFGLDTAILRYFNVYSEHQVKKTKLSTLICEWMFRLQKEKILYISGDGEQRRDMTHISDAVDSNIFLMNQSRNFNGEVFDVGTGSNISLNEIKNMILKEHSNAIFKYTEDRKGDVKLTKADTSKLSKLGWKSSVSIFDGLTKCFSKDTK